MKNTSKEALLDGALKVFGEKPVAEVRIEDITNAAKCGKGTFYKHFANKNECLYGVCIRMCNQVVEQLELILESSEPEKAIYDIFDYYLGEILDNKTLVKAFFYDSVSLGPKFEMIMINIKHTFRDIFHRAVYRYNPDANYEVLCLQSSIMYSMLIEFCYYGVIDETFTKAKFFERLTYVLRRCA